MSTIVKARVDEDLKDKATEILEQSGLTISDAIRIMLHRIVADNDYVLIPNALTAEIIRKARNGTDVYRISSVEELFEDLDV